MIMKISRFVHVLDDSTIWDAINRKKVSLKPEDVKYIQDNMHSDNINDIPYDLLKFGLVVKIEDEKKLIDKLIEQTTDKQFQSLFLITTTECNLDCDYCFYRSSMSQSLLKRKMMSWDIAKQSIDKFYDIVLNNKITKGYWQQITFYGGEPLLNKKLLKQAIPYTYHKFADDYTRIVINTNLTLLDDEIVNLFKDYNVEVQVSIDGNKDQHNCHRKTLSGIGTYDSVIKNIKILLSKGIKVLPMITATEANVLNFSDTISEIVDDLNIDDFAVNILISESYKTNDEYIELLSTEMIKAYEKFGTKASDVQFEDLYERVLGKQKTIIRNECGSTRKITIFPDGQVYACQALEKLDINNMGTISEEFQNHTNWAYWRNRNRFTNDTCLDCEMITACGGGCATGSYNSTGSIYGIDNNQCKYNQKVFTKLMKKY